MQTIIMDMREKTDPEMIRRAGEILRSGGLVAFPTETVYGLGGNALDEASSAKIYAAKGRPSDNPLIVHIERLEDLELLVTEIPQSALILAQAFWPGPLTMILPKSPIVPDTTTGGLKTVAVRMPNHPAALELIRAAGGFVAAPSANTSGRPSPTSAAHVIEDLDGRIDCIIDGGSVGIGLESTIVDLTGETPEILRPGYISRAMLEEVLGKVTVDKGLTSEDEKVRPRAPGMKYRHYAPKAQLAIVEGEENDVVRTIRELVRKDTAAGLKVGIIAASESAGRYGEGTVRAAGTRSDERTIAMHLYALLREFDELETDRIYSEAFEEGQLGDAIMNRLLKAAGHHVIRAEKV